MDFDFTLFSGFSMMALKKPTKPIKVEAPKQICLHSGENAGQYQTFLQTVNDLAMMFKFSSLRTSLKGYTNLDVSPEASVWDLITGEEGSKVNSADTSVLDELNAYFDWNAVKSAGGSQSYYDIANGDLSSLSDEDAFYLMCSMLDSRERVAQGFESIFGAVGGLNDDSTVIDNIELFLKGLDPHNIGLISLFYSMQPSFINALDAYTNCTTFWGKVDGYIGSLSGEQQTAASSLKSMWSDGTSRWDEVGDVSVKDLTKDQPGYEWYSFFKENMAEFNNQDAVRIICGNIFSKSADLKYKKAKEKYESDKEDLIQQEIFLMKMQAKQFAKSKSAFKKLLGRKSKTSRVGRIKGRRTSIAARRAPRVAPRPVVSAARRSQSMAIAAGLARRNVRATVAPRVHASIAPKAYRSPVMAKKQSKDDKKVI